MKFISTNLRFDTQEDGKHQWSNRKEIMADVIKQFSPAIMGTQEGWKPQIDQLAQLIPPMKLVDQHREWILDRMYPCIFYHPQKVKIIESGDFWLSETPEIAGSSSFDSAWPRLASWVVAKDLEINKDFLFVNTHLDNVLDKTRLLQSEVLITEIKKIRKDLPLILAGDFNSFPASDTYSNIIKNLNLYDSWRKEEEGSFHNFTGNAEENYRIDWILLDKKINCDNIEFEKHSSKGIYPSDHFPVKAVLSL